MENQEQKEILWIGSAKADLDTFPKPVKRHVGYALNYAQNGDKHPEAKPLSGFGSAQVQEIVSKDRSGTYRSVYTVQFEDYVYVLHCFQKKSTTGIKTSKQDIDLIKKRLQAAEADFKARKEE
jgi:phage-related protein